MEHGNIVHHLRRHLAESLSPERYRHVIGVAETAVQLAERFGAPPLDAELAAWLHDLAREWPKERLIAYVRDHGVQVPDEWLRAPVLLHGPVAAHVGRAQYGVESGDVHDAVYYHTTGRPGMGRLELVLFVADAIEPLRAYPGVERIRQLAETNLLAAARESLDSTLRYLLERKLPLDAITVSARNDLLQREQQGQP